MPVYFPTEHTVQHVNNVSVNEEIVYKDRYHDEYPPIVSEWLSRIDHADDEDCEDGDEQEQVPTQCDDEVSDNASELVDFVDLEEMKPAVPIHDKSDGEVSDYEGEVGIEEWANMPCTWHSRGRCPRNLHLKLTPDAYADLINPHRSAPGGDSTAERHYPDGWTDQPPWNCLNIVDAYTTRNLSDSEAEEIDAVEKQEENNENVMLEEEDPGDPRDVEHIPAEPELATTKEEDDELAEDEAPEHAIVAIDAGNGMDTCMIPEHLTGVQRSSLEAELQDVQDIKRQRDSEGQPTKMTLRSSEERRVPPRCDDYQLYASYCERRAVWLPQCSLWRQGMDREMEAIFRKRVFELIDKSDVPSNTRLLSTMWIYRVKTDNEGYIIRWRSRLVGRGDFQLLEVDYNETLSPVARMMTFRVVIVISAKLGLVLYQGDIDTAYLNARPKIKQYVRSIPGYPCPEGKVYQVNQALYGLCQSRAEWYEEVDKWLRSQGFENTLTELCLYVYYKHNVFALIPVYVDDVVLATNSEEFKTTLFAEKDKKYGFKDGGQAKRFLGIQVEQSAEAVGALTYLTTSTRPDIAFSVGYLSRFVSKPTKKHCGALKRNLRYLVGTTNLGIMYSGSSSMDDRVIVSGHRDADWGNDPDTRKSVTGFVLTIAGCAVAWAARRQTIIAQSTAEAEYVAACEATMEGRGVVNMMDEALPKINMSTELTMRVDNNAAIAFATAPTYSRKTRHIELRCHYVRNQVLKKLVSIYKVDGTENPVDLFTKALPKARLVKFRSMIGMVTALPNLKENIPDEVGGVPTQSEGAVLRFASGSNR
ncbi:unnamed protein product [Phytophthora fragariaefolia]|uniref:Unnamed protein product n=1 Tax=Phytophthora fragariaefolia TaxID=1490495 RepID=A0A9W6XV12_9STRA|nr:unnamed protein product [Phytophthora fragariaefolia]